MSLLVEININRNIRVRLTDHGKKVHFNWMKKLLPDRAYVPPVEYKDGWSKWHLWEFMNIFGPHIYMGSEQVIEENAIQIISED